ncbi:MAG: hypothetical protein NZ902_01800 [Acidilobaceae archaeon]|nr:hypothetical protein [Acidilobaceae archaeon]MCX8165559.1 hypothetical protein [Acidilobaceae archaeon]MDW7973986.1 hypothetical protein [Sulfolobales archaeon]
MAVDAEREALIFDASAEEKLGFVSYLLAAAASLRPGERIHALDAVAEIVDEAIARYRNPAYVEALEAIGYPMVDAFELVETLGAESLEAVLSYAEKALRGEPAEPPEEVSIYADLLGWTKEPSQLSNTVLASAILISFVASFNRTVNEAIEAQDD